MAGHALPVIVYGLFAAAAITTAAFIVRSIQDRRDAKAERRGR